jgi:hypothetical protein
LLLYQRRGGASGLYHKQFFPIMYDENSVLLTIVHITFINIFVHLGFSMSNRVTDTLESKSILNYFQTGKSIYTQKCDYIINIFQS